MSALSAPSTLRTAGPSTAASTSSSSRAGDREYRGGRAGAETAAVLDRNRALTLRKRSTNLLQLGVYLERRRFSGSPGNGSPAIVSGLTRSSASVVSCSASFSNSPWTEPVTSPE